MRLPQMPLIIVKLYLSQDDNDLFVAFNVIFCNALVVKCNDPGFVDNSTRKVANGFLFNTNVIYECYPGFRMIGVPFLTCKSDGKWNREKPWCQS